MDPLLLWILTISLMFSGSQCESQSTSCSTVNGRMVCETQRSAGNVAGSSSSAMYGPGGSYQDAAAMTGNSYTGQYASSKTRDGNAPPGFGSGVFGPGVSPFSFGVAPTFGGGSDSPAGPSASNTGTGNTFVASTSGSDGTGAGGAFAGSAAGGFGGSAAGGFGGSSGGFVGTSAGGFGGFGGSGVFVGGGAVPGIPGFGTGGGVFVGNMNPAAMFGPSFPFNIGGGFPFGRRR